VDFILSDEARAISDTAREWATDLMKPSLAIGPNAGADVFYARTDYWTSFLELGLLSVVESGGSIIDEVVGLVEATRYGLPGPVLEAALAVSANTGEAAAALGSGKVVTSVRSDTGGPTPVAWGAVADLVVDQSTGDILARSPLPAVQMSHPLPHGWIDAPVATTDDRLATHRWLLASALCVGLGNGALQMALAHARDRHQFGRPLGANQAIQLRLADAYIGWWGARQTTLEAAWRISAGLADGPVAAALAWLWTAETSRRLARHCHQVFGALGFCEELGLTRLTAQLEWLRASVGRASAVDLAVKSRRHGTTSRQVRILHGY
jgi:Acyl-CoA dehydrogenase, C-terminal domain